MDSEAERDFEAVEFETLVFAGLTQTLGDLRGLWLCNLTHSWFTIFRSVSRRVIMAKDSAEVITVESILSEFSSLEVPRPTINRNRVNTLGDIIVISVTLFASEKWTTISDTTTSHNLLY
jgi:hypothetical protein